jgi:hypothetical protein
VVLVPGFAQNRPEEPNERVEKTFVVEKVLDKKVVRAFGTPAVVAFLGH